MTPNRFAGFRTRTALLILLLLAALCALPAAAEESAAEPDEWTVMIYLCGSDLESRYGYATGNLAELRQVMYPNNFQYSYMGLPVPEPKPEEIVGKVNVLIETGGSKRWKGIEDESLDISPDRLERWTLHYHYNDFQTEPYPDRFERKETLPLRSMADPETLADFIRWCAKEYPAKKYALVLWDHGGGAKNGLFLDELFDNDIMYLYELKQALADGGVTLEALVIDACLMANIETAWTVKDYARWMVASEEVVPGKGTAMGQWMQELVSHPDLDGEWLGRCICDATMVKYANEPDEMFRRLMTWSVIDLSKIDALMEALHPFFLQMNEAIKFYPMLAKQYSYYMFKTEEYGDGQQNMRDLGSLLYNGHIINLVDSRMLGRIKEALQDAVTYIVRGPGRSWARGLSFCYPADFTKDEIETYTRNFPIPEYMAYLDAITAWDAPDSLYEKTERLPDINTIEELKITVKKERAADGMPAIYFGSSLSNMDNAYYTLYRLNDETGEILRMGRTNCRTEYREGSDLIWRPTDPMHWPAVEGALCCIDLIQEEGDLRLYNIPVQINQEHAMLRCGRDSDSAENGLKEEYEIYGIWEGYEENSELMNRSVVPLVTMSGRKCRMLFPVDGSGKDGGTNYAPGQEVTIFRALDIREIPVPAGTYFLEIEVVDMFMRTARLERIRIDWDGEKIIYPEDFEWEGTVTLDFTGE